MSMTEKEAIVQLNFDMEMIRFNPETGETLTLEQIEAQNEANYKTYLADEMAITALIENQQYKAIGTVEELRSMKENGAFSGIELAQIAAMQMKLKAYVDAEEQGLLFRLPCPIGTTVYSFDRQIWIDEKGCRDCVYYGVDGYCDYEEESPDCTKVFETKFNFNMRDEFGKTVFFTKAEAEQALTDMKRKINI